MLIWIITRENIHITTARNLGKRETINTHVSKSHLSQKNLSHVRIIKRIVKHFGISLIILE